MSLSSRRLSPPFGQNADGAISMTRGYVWDGVTFPVPQFAYGVGDHAVLLNLEQLQRWQCRLDFWDNEARFTDTIGGNPTITKVYGTPPPTGQFSSFQLRILNTADSGALVAGGAAGSGTIALDLDIRLLNLTNADETQFYPTITVTGNTWMLTDNLPFPGQEFFLLVSSNPQDISWVSYGTVVIDDGTGTTFSVPLWRQPDGPGTILAFYELDYFNAKPTQYLTS